MFRKKIAVFVTICLVLASMLSMMPITKVSAGTQATYYVSPAGSDTSGDGSIGNPWQTIQKARDVVRTISSNMTGDIYVYLRGGTYTLASTLTYDYRDSGTNGYVVIYKAYTGETPVISGGKTITGWTLYDATKNIYRASAGQDIETRQLYVNNVRATRARSTGGLPGAVKNTNGYTTTDTNMQNYGNKGDIEFVYDYVHIQMRRGVSTISGITITMDQPCWSMAFFVSDYPTYMENAYEWLDNEGEWYLDRSTDYFYYKPRTGENMSTATVVAPVLETLLNGAGTLDNPVHNMRFEGITFSYATWLRPNGTEGFVDIQAQFCFKPNATKEYNYDMDNWVKTPANVTFSAAKNIVFERNKFTKLGAVGLGFETGSQDNTISGNEFTDISSTGIQIGGTTTNDHHPTDARYVVKNNTIKNNYIHNVGAEYKGAVGIFAGYTENTLIANNELCDLPYSGISVGWGWGGADYNDCPHPASRDYLLPYIGNSNPSTCKDNKIISNHIYDVMKYCIDGGGIYTLGSQEGTIITGNVVHEVKDYYGAIYLDNQSRYMTVRYNLLYNNVMNWITKDADHDIEFNYSDKDRGDYWTQYDSLVANNFYITNASVPAYILDNAGLETAYQDLLTRYSVNLAIGKSATGYYNDGSPANMWTNAEAYRAIDGDTSTKAQATGQYAWTEQIDLWSTYNINRVKTIFGSGTYATEYQIQVSTDGTNFTTVKSVTGCTGGESDQTFTAVDARYVRIKAIKPDGPDQTGTQMGIAEMEVYGKPTFTPSAIPFQSVVVKPEIAGYNNNIAYNKTATGYYNDGSLANMWSGCEASKAVDGSVIVPNKAQAYGQYAWTEQVDFGAVYNIASTRVYFAPDCYATEYDIQVSTDGINFTTVKNVTGFTGGADDQAFTPIDARYIRIKAIKPDGPNQPGAQMAISELYVPLNNNVLKMSQMTDGSASGNKYLYQKIAANQFSFQSGDVISYDTKLFTNNGAIGGLEIYNTDGTGFGGTGWVDQNGIGGSPAADLTSRALNQWYHRELTVPVSMVGKTSSKWMLAFENDSVATILQAAYDNIVVKRGGNVILTVYKDGNPSVNTLEIQNGYFTQASAFKVSR